MVDKALPWTNTITVDHRGRYPPETQPRCRYFQTHRITPHSVPPIKLITLFITARSSSIMPCHPSLFPFRRLVQDLVARMARGANAFILIIFLTRRYAAGTYNDHASRVPDRPPRHRPPPSGDKLYPSVKRLPILESFPTRRYATMTCSFTCTYRSLVHSRHRGSNGPHTPLVRHLPGLGPIGFGRHIFLVSPPWSNPLPTARKYDHAHSAGTNHDWAWLPARTFLDSSWRVPGWFLDGSWTVPGQFPRSGGSDLDAKKARVCGNLVGTSHSSDFPVGLRSISFSSE